MGVVGMQGRGGWRNTGARGCGESRGVGARRRVLGAGVPGTRGAPCACGGWDTAPGRAEIKGAFFVRLWRVGRCPVACGDPRVGGAATGAVLWHAAAVIRVVVACAGRFVILDGPGGAVGVRGGPFVPELCGRELKGRWGLFTIRPRL